MAKFSRFRFQPVLPLGPKGRFVTGCTSHRQLAQGQIPSSSETSNNICAGNPSGSRRFPYILIGPARVPLTLPMGSHHVNVIMLVCTGFVNIPKSLPGQRFNCSAILFCFQTNRQISYLSVIICFVMFLVNDLYGFASWKRMEKRRMEIS